MPNYSAGYKELLKLAKKQKVETIGELEDLVNECENEVSGGDFEGVKNALKIKRF